MQYWIDRSDIAHRPMPKLGETAEEKAARKREPLAWGLETGAVRSVVQAYRVALAAGLAAATLRLCAKPNTSEPPSATFVESAIPSTLEPSPAAADAAANPPAPTPPHEPAVRLVGKSENELRALLGSPTNEEDRPPGKRWRYRDGQCTLDVQLYPDVQTKQFGTLAYEVRSDDNTDEGRRVCMAQLQSRAQARH